MSRKQNYFSGSFASLFAYWQNEERTRRFVQGGTRIQMIHDVVDEQGDRLTKGIWIDIGTGAGFIQQVIAEKFAFRGLAVGVDMSIAMLQKYLNREVQRVAGVFQALPFRKGSVDTTSSFFCLSDYPNLRSIFQNFADLLRPHGNILYIDYTRGDQYWEIRKKSTKLIGNINLRTPEYIAQILTEIPTLQIDFTDANAYEVSAHELKQRLPELPDTLTRKFLYCRAERISPVSATS